MKSGRAFVADGMEVKKFNEVPMSAMWTQAPGVNKEQYDYNADDRESASVAHIYGQNLAAAESMTAAAAPWAWSPATLKPTADQELLNGINRFVIHESAHQPLVDKAPGLTLGPFGQWFNRNETWAEEAGPWVDYIARSSYLLQQGHFGADLLYFYGEDSNLTAIFENKAPDVPAGYGFDYINADGLIHKLNVTDGRITTKSGMSYRVAGARSVQPAHVVAGAAGHSQAGGGRRRGCGPEADRRSQPGRRSGGVPQAERRTVWRWHGRAPRWAKARCMQAETLADVFNALKVAPDFDYTKPESDTRILFVHRKLADGDLYFVDNRNDRDETVDATLPRDRQGAGTVACRDRQNRSRRLTQSRMAAPPCRCIWSRGARCSWSSASRPRQTSRTLPTRCDAQAVATVEGPWKVSFPPGRGAPASITLDKLIVVERQRGCGGEVLLRSGTYTKTIQAPATGSKRARKCGSIWAT